MAFYDAALNFLVYLGLLDVVLPFVLICTIVFSVLQRTQIFGKNKSRLNLTVALVLSLGSVAALKVVSAVTKIAQYGAFMIVILVVLWLILGLVGISGLKNKHIVPAIGFFLITILALSALGAWNIVDLSFIDRSVVYTVLAIIAFIAIIGFVAAEKPSKQSGTSAQKNKEPTEKEVPGRFERV